MTHHRCTNVRILDAFYLKKIHAGHILFYMHAGVLADAFHEHKNEFTFLCIIRFLKDYSHDVASKSYQDIVDIQQPQKETRKYLYFKINRVVLM